MLPNILEVYFDPEPLGFRLDSFDGTPHHFADIYRSNFQRVLPGIHLRQRRQFFDHAAYPLQFPFRQLQSSKFQGIQPVPRPPDKIHGALYGR
jgi:hypothetical protein